MKKIITGVLTAALCAGMTVPAFAADVTTEGSQNTALTYSVAADYVVTIPETVALNEDLVIFSNKANTEPGKAVKVQITGLTDAGAAELARTDDQEYKITAQAKQNGKAITNDTVVAKFADVTAKEEAPAITFDAPAAASGEIKAGHYTGSLTFTVSYEAE